MTVRKPVSKAQPMLMTRLGVVALTAALVHKNADMVMLQSWAVSHPLSQTVVVMVY